MASPDTVRDLKWNVWLPSKRGLQQAGLAWRGASTHAGRGGRGPQDRQGLSSRQGLLQAGLATGGACPARGAERGALGGGALPFSLRGSI